MLRRGWPAIGGRPRLARPESGAPSAAPGRGPQRAFREVPGERANEGRERVPADGPSSAGPGEQRGGLGAALHRDARGKGNAVNAAPRQACGQSTIITPPLAIRRLSARMSACSSVSPAAWTVQVASRAASSGRRALDHGSRRSSSGTWDSVRHPVKSVPRYSERVGTATGAGVRTSATWSSVASTASSSRSRQGSSGCPPAASSATSANHGPDSAVPRSRGTGSSRRQSAGPVRRVRSPPGGAAAGCEG